MHIVDFVCFTIAMAVLWYFVWQISKTDKKYRNYLDGEDH